MSIGVYSWWETSSSPASRPAKSSTSCVYSQASGIFLGNTYATCHRFLSLSHKDSRIAAVSIGLAKPEIYIDSSRISEIEQCSRHSIRVLGESSGENTEKGDPVEKLETAGAGCGRENLETLKPISVSY